MAKETLTMAYWSEGSPCEDLFDDSSADCKDTLLMDYWSEGAPTKGLYEAAAAPSDTGFMTTNTRFWGT